MLVCPEGQPTATLCHGKLHVASLGQLDGPSTLAWSPWLHTNSIAPVTGTTLADPQGKLATFSFDHAVLYITLFLLAPELLDCGWL